MKTVQQFINETLEPKQMENTVFSPDNEAFDVSYLPREILIIDDDLININYALEVQRRNIDEINRHLLNFIRTFFGAKTKGEPPKDDNLQPK